MTRAEGILRVEFLNVFVTFGNIDVLLPAYGDLVSLDDPVSFGKLDYHTLGYLAFNGNMGEYLLWLLAYDVFDENITRIVRIKRGENSVKEELIRMIKGEMPSWDKFLRDLGIN